MKKLNASQLALYTLMALALACGPALAQDEDAAPSNAPAHAETKAAKPAAKAKAEKPADTKKEAEVKKEKVAEPVEAKSEQPITETTGAAKSVDLLDVEKKADNGAVKPVASSAPTETNAVPVVAPAPQAASQGIFQKLRSFFGQKKVLPAGVPEESLSRVEPLPLSSPPTGTSSPAEAKAPAAAASPGEFIPTLPHIPPSLPAPSAPPPPATPVVRADPPNLKQAEKVAKLFDLKQKLQGPAGPVTMLMMMELDHANPGMMPTTQKAIAEGQAKFAADHEEEMQEETARFYAENFTADELQKLKEFYESSAGQKLMKNGDDLQRRQSMFGNEVAMKNVNALREEIMKAAKKYDLKPPVAPTSPPHASEAPKLPGVHK